MANSIRSFQKGQQSTIVQNRLTNGTMEMALAKEEKRKPMLGLGYWGAVAARNRGL